MANKSNITHMPQFLWPNGNEPPKSVGRSNCTLFLDHPELLEDWILEGVEMPSNIEKPSYQRRGIRIRRGGGKSDT